MIERKKKSASHCPDIQIYTKSLLCLAFFLTIAFSLTVISRWCYISAFQTHPHNCSDSSLFTQILKKGKSREWGVMMDAELMERGETGKERERRGAHVGDMKFDAFN